MNETQPSLAQGGQVPEGQPFSSPGGGPALRRLELAVRLLWLVPVTAAVCAQAVFVLGWTLRFPQTALANAPRTGLELVFLAVIFWWCVRAWRRTVSIARGEVPLSTAWVLLRCGAVFLLCAFVGLVALPKGLEVRRLYGEALNRDGLRLLRNALQRRLSAAGRYPDDPRELAKDPRDGLAAIPWLWDTWGARFPHHPTAEVSVRYKMEAVDTGQWAYVAVPSGPERGAIYVDCTHTDSVGRAWAAY
ncbi:MAG: hypothetical protein HY748_01850 [Elusimicrobia bacterium]|nr:hypothetical protein [Elusimicrobiota bacterium]